jgi:hypothetical protein
VPYSNRAKTLKIKELFKANAESRMKYRLPDRQKLQNPDEAQVPETLL